MNSFEKWDSLNKALKRARRNMAVLFTLYALLDIVGLVGLAFVPYCDARNESWAFIALLIGIVPICLSPYLLYEYFHNKHDRYSILTQLSKDAACSQAFDDAIRSAQIVDSRIAATKEGIYSLKSSYHIPVVIPANDMVWLYIRQRWYYKHPDPQLSIVTRDKRVYKLPLNAKLLFSNLTQTSESLVLDSLRTVYPHLFFGYTAQNRALFKNHFSEMFERAKK
jgi:hypothetical protein